MPTCPQAACCEGPSWHLAQSTCSSSASRCGLPLFVFRERDGVLLTVCFLIESPIPEHCALALPVFLTFNQKPRSGHSAVPAHRGQQCARVSIHTASRSPRRSRSCCPHSRGCPLSLRPPCWQQAPVHAVSLSWQLEMKLSWAFLGCSLGHVGRSLLGQSGSGAVGSGIMCVFTFIR